MQDFPYKKYRWFFTSSDKLVVGGKSAEQNEALLSSLKKENEDYLVLHTSLPGSPFSIILAEKNKLKPSDIEEAAIFTACFSQQWKSGKSKANVDIFSLSQIYKSKLMKRGTWGVAEKVEKKSVQLKLVLTKQKGVLRAVPEKTARNYLLKAKPGKTDKTKLVEKINSLLKEKLKKEEILSALPSGGVSITK